MEVVKHLQGQLLITSLLTSAYRTASKMVIAAVAFIVVMERLSANCSLVVGPKFQFLQLFELEAQSYNTAGSACDCLKY